MCVQCSFQRWHKALLILRTSFFYLSIAQRHSWMLLAATDIFYITSDSSVSTCLFYCSTSDVYLKNGTGYFKEKKHFIFKENINFWEQLTRCESQGGLTSSGFLITDQVISESEYLNFVCAMPASLKTQTSAVQRLQYLLFGSRENHSCDLQKQVVTHLLMKVSQGVMHYERYFTDVCFVFIKMCKIHTIKNMSN